MRTCCSAVKSSLKCRHHRRFASNTEDSLRREPMPFNELHAKKRNARNPTLVVLDEEHVFEWNSEHSKPCDVFAHQFLNALWLYAIHCDGQSRRRNFENAAVPAACHQSLFEINDRNKLTLRSKYDKKGKKEGKERSRPCAGLGCQSRQSKNRREDCGGILLGTMQGCPRCG